tara:strand:- start:454 stop:1725 length:1272 start_codon:yes stop_codon:yes gene_type:complete
MNILLTRLVYFLGLISLFLENSIRLDLKFIFLFWILQILRIGLFKKINSRDLIFLTLLIMLFLIPSISIYFYYKLDLTNILIIVVIFYDLLRKFFSDYKYYNFYSKNIYVNQLSRYVIYLILVTWSISAPFFFGQGNHLLGMLSFMFPTAISLVIFEKILRNNRSVYQGAILLFIHFGFVIIYLSNHWSGFGRLFLGFYILAPIIIYMTVYKISFRPWMILLISPIALFLLQYARFKSQLSLEDTLISSAGFHLILTDMVNMNNYSFNNQGLQAFFEQFQLMFFSWFPREIWFSKPVGISYWSVDVMFDRSKIINGPSYSQSMGFIGEQILLLKHYYIAGLLLCLISLIIIRKIIVYFSYGSNVPAIIFDLHLMSYFWGGMATFGSRVWFLLIPLLIYNFIRHKLLLGYVEQIQNNTKNHVKG